ncbi:hypothetical protein XELAEV_18041494mg [Xenopus laevis]|uniref:Uncharacterized protein n=1 Tax=Xenopus laevis TaxID=8355 RepID=A0A974H554_XENLA|nr:hypothetical protein XELAEV_18041494mg [Xenopus laevis]
MRKKTTVIAGQGVRTHLGSKKKTAAPGLAVVENIQQVNSLDDKAVVAAVNCSSAVGCSSSAAESCSSEASQEPATRHAGSQEGCAAGYEAVMESAEAACCVAMEEALREKPNPTAAAAMAQVGAMHLCDHGGEEAASNGAGKPETVGSAGPNHSQIIRALKDIHILEEKRNSLEWSVSNMVAGLGALKGTESSKAVRKIALMSNDLEDIENNIIKSDSWGWQFGAFVCGFPVSVPGDSVSALSVPGASVSGVSVQCDKAAGSTNMAVPLYTVLCITVCDAAVRENIAGESSVTEGAGNPPVNMRVKGHMGGEVFLYGKRLFRQIVSEVGESQAGRRKNLVKIKWVKVGCEFLGRRFVARNLIKGVIGLYSCRCVWDGNFDLSFKLSQGLDTFWRKNDGRCDALAKKTMHCPVPPYPII